MAERTPLVLALGYFDGVHLGHAALLETAKTRAAALNAQPAVLTFDRHPDTLVRNIPVELLYSSADRDGIFREMFGIPRILYFPFNEATMRMGWRIFLETITRQYAPVHFVVGHDFSFGDQGRGNPERLGEFCREQGLGVDVIPAVTLAGETISSTRIRTLLRAGELALANAMLGHPHFLTDTVRHGFRRGREMNFPTINQRFADGVLIPRWGVYATKVYLPDGSVRTGVTNIGKRPTFHGLDVTVETHILDFREELYSDPVKVEFHAFLRPEQLFPSPHALERQMRRDLTLAKTFFDSNRKVNL